MASSLPNLVCFDLVPPIELVDFIFFNERTFGSLSSSGLLYLFGNSLTSLRDRKFLNSLAIFSRVVPRFFGVLGTTEGGPSGGADLGGDAGSGLSTLEV